MGCADLWNHVFLFNLDDQIGFEAKEMQFEELDSRIHKIENVKTNLK